MRTSLLVGFAPVLLLSLSGVAIAERDKSHKEADSMPATGAQATLPIRTPVQVAAIGNHAFAFGIDVNGGPAGTASGSNPQGDVTDDSPTTAEPVNAQPRALANQEPLDDAKILNVAHVANAAEIEQAKLAQARAKDARVRRLAAMILKHHRAAQKTENDIIRRGALELGGSATAERLQSNDKKVMNELAGKSGAEFDRAYVDAQIDGHKVVLGILESRLIPNATDKDVKTLMTSLRQPVRTHLQEAEKLKTDLKAKESP